MTVKEMGPAVVTRRAFSQSGMLSAPTRKSWVISAPDLCTGKAI
jgi:hypothetical protein